MYGANFENQPGWVDSKSSNILKWRYDHTVKLLSVVFRSSPKIYDYNDFSEDEARSFKDAESQGKFLAKYKGVPRS